MSVPSCEVTNNEGEVFVKRRIDEVAEERPGGKVMEAKIEDVCFLVWEHYVFLPSSNLE